MAERVSNYDREVAVLERLQVWCPRCDCYQYVRWTILELDWTCSGCGAVLATTRPIPPRSPA
ncbi:MAG TPA: hypothetical protein VNI83_02235 [Vicinamibacterales bacterium]|nr:hypothetical protein [Vicinamibacterales bacterium]